MRNLLLSLFLLVGSSALSAQRVPVDTETSPEMIEYVWKLIDEIKVLKEQLRKTTSISERKRIDRDLQQAYWNLSQNYKTAQRTIRSLELEIEEKERALKREEKEYEQLQLELQRLRREVDALTERYHQAEREAREAIRERDSLQTVIVRIREEEKLRRDDQLRDRNKVLINENIDPLRPTTTQKPPRLEFFTFDLRYDPLPGEKDQGKFLEAQVKVCTPKYKDTDKIICEIWDEVTLTRRVVWDPENEYYIEKYDNANSPRKYYLEPNSKYDKLIFFIKIASWDHESDPFSVRR